MKTLLYLLLKNPFTKRDFERMGVEALEQHFEVRILDCTAWLMPKAFLTRGTSAMKLTNLRTIGSLRELKDELRTTSGGIAIDYVGQFSPKAVLLFNIMKSSGFKLVVLDSGACPSPNAMGNPDSILMKLINAAKNRHLHLYANAMIIKLLLKCLPDQSADYAFVAGTSWSGNPRFSRAAIKIPAHSFDYEKYLQLRMRPGNRTYDYAVYLDEDIADHEDNLELGLAAPVTADRYYPAFSQFFRKFEAIAGMPVIVAGYPSERTARAKCFDGREFVRGETAQLIRDAKYVFAHASTAISFAVLWRRPIVFVTSDELTESWYYPSIDVRRRMLFRPMVNIDGEQSQIDLIRWREIDQSAYILFEETYIKSKGSREVSLWEMLLSVKSTPEARIPALLQE